MLAVNNSLQIYIIIKHCAKCYLLLMYRTQPNMDERAAVY